MDSFKQGDRIKVFVGEVEENTKFTKTFISRKSEELLRGLLKLEIPEMEEGIIEIKNIAREAGSRAKVAVYSNDENLDVKGACIGKNGLRIQSVIDELGGEKIDVVLWDEDIKEFVKNSLNPAQVLSVEIIEEDGENKENKKISESEGEKTDKELEKTKIARVFVKDGQLSLAIGKKGQNSRLAARLCGIKIDINTVEDNEI